MSDYSKKLLERVVRTFLVAFLGALAVAAPDGGITLAGGQAALLAGVAAAGSLLLGLITKGVGPADDPGIV